MKIKNKTKELTSEEIYLITINGLLNNLTLLEFLKLYAKKLKEKNETEK